MRNIRGAIEKLPDDGGKRSALALRVNHDLTLHPPSSDAVGREMDVVRQAFKDLADEVVWCLPIGREQSLALTKIEEACFYAIAAIARTQ